MAEWSKALDSSSSLHLKAWVRIPPEPHCLASWRNWIAHQTSNLGVAGSSPAGVVAFAPGWGVGEPRDRLAGVIEPRAGVGEPRDRLAGVGEPRDAVIEPREALAGVGESRGRVIEPRDRLAGVGEPRDAVIEPRGTGRRVIETRGAYFDGFARRCKRGSLFVAWGRVITSFSSLDLFRVV